MIHPVTPARAARSRRRLAALAIGATLAMAAVPGLVHGQEPATVPSGDVELRDMPDGEVIMRFLAAFNEGRYDHLEAFFNGNLPDDAAAASAAASYWLSVYHEIGPVRLEIVDSEEDPPLLWMRGERTGGWVGFRFVVDSGRIGGYGVRRGITPAGALELPSLERRNVAARVFGYFETLAQADLYSGTALVARDGVPLVEGAWGWADRGFGVQNHLDTRFDIASVTKTFTAVAIAQLAARGVLALDDLLERWLPELPDPIGRSVTIRHLLTHTSGIELDDHAPYNEAVEAAGPVAELLAAQVAFMEHLNEGQVEGFRPPDAFDYSNENFDLLGAIVERASGRPWEVYLREEIFGPAGMFATGVDYRAPVEDMATRYTARFPGFRGDRRVVAAGPATQARPAGGAYSTVGDLLRFAEALRDGTLLDPVWWSRIATFQVVALDEPENRLGYGYGFEVDRKAGLLRVGHSGGSSGVSARLDIYPELGYTVILLSNYDRATRHPADHLGALLARAEEPR